jgi:hypothetical protein
LSNEEAHEKEVSMIGRKERSHVVKEPVIMVATSPDWEAVIAVIILWTQMTLATGRRKYSKLLIICFLVLVAYTIAAVGYCGG